MIKHIIHNLKNNYTFYFSVFTGFIILVAFIWIHYIRGHISRDIPFNLSLLTLVILIITCTIFLIQVIRILKPRTTTTLFLEIITYVQIITQPLLILDNTVRQLFIIKQLLENGCWHLHYINYKRSSNLFGVYLPQFEKEGLVLPFPIETFPTTSLSGSFTVSKVLHDSLLVRDTPFVKSSAYVLARYITTIYGGERITSIADILNRLEQLFTQDSLIHDYSYPANHIQGIERLNPLLQHFLAFDFYNLSTDKKNVSWPSNYNTSLKHIPIIKINEINVIKQTHSFLSKENKDEILIINNQDPEHIKILNQYKHLIYPTVKQYDPEMLGSCTLALGHKMIYPIDTKLIGYPELYLNMIASHASLSPKYIFKTDLDKTVMQYNIIKKSPDTPNHIKDFIEELNKIKDNSKKISPEKDTTELLNTWRINLFIHLRSHGFIHNKISFTPLIIVEEPLPSKDNYFQMLQKENPNLLEEMINYIKNNAEWKQLFLTQEQYKTYPMYPFMLEIMKIAQKYDFIENYYIVRQLLEIKDIHYGLH